MNIHFVCRGNVLRSLIAETYVRSLRLSGVTTRSSGVAADNDDRQEREFFANTVTLLTRHGIEPFAKRSSDQLTQARVDGNGITVCMNQRVIDEAGLIVKLPDNVRSWGIIDIGEGYRTDRSKRESYEEDIFNEIIIKVDELMNELDLNRR